MLGRSLLKLKFLHARLGTRATMRYLIDRYVGSRLGLQFKRNRAVMHEAYDAETRRQRSARLQLICPVCHGELELDAGSCTNCGFTMADVAGVPVVREVGPGERIDYLEESASLPIQNSSHLSIAPVAQALAEENGLILELGAGIDVCDHPRLVKTDAFVYSPQLDYVVDAHAMPFPDNTFGFVYSLAVFEHLHTPWKAAKEILRVLKPGGTVYVLTAFMQHMHGYPHHYFNMTTSGVQRIFQDFEIISCEPSKHCPLDQLAVTLLDLHEMASRLPGDKASSQLRRSIEDFCSALPVVQEQLVGVPENFDAWRRLAPGVEIIARKPMPG